MEDLLKLKLQELKKKCKDLGLNGAGNKTELATRIQEHTNKGGDDSVLNEAELLGELDGSDSQVVSNVDEDLLLGDSTSESKEDKNDNLIKPNSEPIEKIVNSEVTESNLEEPLVKTSKLDIENNPKSETSDEQKKQDRAARFGLSDASKEEDKRMARAQRFGLEVKSNGDASINIEKLKQREERFGASVSGTLKKAQENEKKRKRAERFGIPEVSKENPTVDTNESDAKKSLRAARFGLNAENDKMKARAARFA